MRITRLAITGATVLTLAAAAPALAKDIYGSPGPDRLVGTDRKDTIRGYEGNDKIFTRGAFQQRLRWSRPGPTDRWARR